MSLNSYSLNKTLNLNFIVEKKNTIKRKNSIKSGQPTKMDPQKVTQVRGIFFPYFKII